MITYSHIHISEIDLGRMDAEYYRPEFIAVTNQISKSSHTTLRRAGVEIGCSAFYPSIVSHYDFEGNGVPFLRVNEIQDGLLSIDEKTAFLSEKILRENSSSIATCHPLDIVVAKGGNSLGKVALLTKAHQKYAICRDVLVLRTNNLNAISRYYLWLYLHSKTGQSLLIRTASQTGQPHLTIESIARLKIPLLPVEQQKEIESIYHAAEAADAQSRSAYQQAQQMLESEFELDKLPLDKPIGYEASFNQISTYSRIDSEHFQPKYAAIRNLIKEYKYGHQKLVFMCDTIKPNINPKKAPIEQFEYIELSDVDNDLGRVKSSTHSKGGDLPSRARRLLQRGDIIASSVVGSVDKVAIIEENMAGALASTGFFQFRPKPGVSSEYLLALLKSDILIPQFQQQATGGILSAVPDSALKYIIIPSFPETIRNEASRLIAQSHKAKHESEKLLEQAKTRVEELIEKAIAS